MNDDLVFKSASLVPMVSSEWQAKQDPDDREKSVSAVKYRWSGQFINDPKIMGSWKVVAQVADISDFDPEKKTRVNRPLFSKMTFKDGGRTNSPIWAWSGDTLMDLTRFQALKMESKNLNGNDYVFVEIGGFGTRNKPGWKSQLLVLIKE